MIFKDLDGTTYKIALTGHIPKADSSRTTSAGHKLAKELLQKIFPCATILEELNIGRKASLFLDFYLPQYRLGVEVQGRQHYEFVPFFHGSQIGFAESKKRDAYKADLCELNEITLIPLPYNEGEDEWIQRIRRPSR